uniref:Uncharacterized protein n=1 Tax=Brassica oleracea TaxID=3712 RepID=A0A3P6FVD6_BRAOL|nr:unnamed protein product [Brassica oleracea]
MTKPSPLNAQLVPKPSEVEALVTEISTPHQLQSLN